MKAINGVEHVYSTTYDDRVVVTARFLVGTKADEAILRVHDKVRANLDRIPIGIPEPLIVGRGIDDVAILVLTLAPKPEAASRWTDNALYHLAENLRIELSKADNTGLTYSWAAGRTKSGSSRTPRSFPSMGHACPTHGQGKSANRSFVAGQIRDRDRAMPVVAGQTLHGIPDIGLLLLTTRDGRPVYVRDVANIVVDGKPLEQTSWNFAKGANGELTRVPAVSIGIAKRAGPMLSISRTAHAEARSFARGGSEGARSLTISTWRSRAIMARPPATRPTSFCSIWGWRHYPSSS